MLEGIHWGCTETRCFRDIFQRIVNILCFVVGRETLLNKDHCRMKHCHLVSTVSWHNSLTYKVFNKENVNYQNWKLRFQSYVDSYSIQIFIINWEICWIYVIICWLPEVINFLDHKSIEYLVYILKFGHWRINERNFL